MNWKSSLNFRGGQFVFVLFLFVFLFLLSVAAGTIGRDFGHREVSIKATHHETEVFT